MRRKMKVRITLKESMLGTSPANPQIYEDYIGSNAPDAATLTEEIEALGAEAVSQKGITIFPKTEDGKPFLYDYQVKGFFKDACGMLRDLSKDCPSGKLKAYKKAIDGKIFVYPRQIPINFEGEIGHCQRPLRAQTMQGERVSLACSEEIPAGATLEFEIRMLKPEYEEAVREWLRYGNMRGLGQWRNSGKGKFKHEILSAEDYDESEDDEI